MEKSKDSPPGSWSAPPCPFEIRYSPRVLDDIRLTVADAFFRAPRGGVEIGGVLMGDFSGKLLRITGYAPVECEHAFGPSFTLSDRDQQRLAELSGTRAVGWYHSHTRSEIFFSDADREVHDRFFPKPWQIALVLRPHTFQPTRAGFFFREAGGSIRGESSYAEFALEPLPPNADPEPEPEPPSAVGQAIRLPTPPVASSRSHRLRIALLTLLACLAAALLAYDTFRLQADLKTQTARATRAEKSLADARNQLKAERLKNAPSADPGK